MNCSTPGLPVHHQLLEFTQTHVHRVSDAIPLSYSILKKKTPSFFIFYIITGVPLVLKSVLVYQGLSFRKIPVHFMKDSSEKSFLLLQLHPFLI